MHCDGSTTETTDDGLDEALYSDPDDKNDDDCGRSIVLALLLVDIVDDESFSLAPLPQSMEDDDIDDEAEMVRGSLFAELGRVDEVKGAAPIPLHECFDDFSLFTEFGRVRRPCTMTGSVLLPRNSSNS